ncbi:conjugal transfer protein [Clostridium perfringens]|nr:conjugal transfer protein [Clostridium perfringens]
MKKIKSYTGIWNVEKVIYAINDFQLPFPVTFTQMTWFVITLFIIILFGKLPPLSMIDGAFLKYLGIPIGITWFMSQKTFDGKKPYGFLKSIILYSLRAKITYAGKRIKFKNKIIDENITIVRSELYVPHKIYREQSCI